MKPARSLQCRRILASEVASERILIKRAPSWIQTRKRLSQADMAANSKMAANLRSRAPKRLHCRLTAEDT